MKGQDSASRPDYLTLAAGFQRQSPQALKSVSAIVFLGRSTNLPSPLNVLICKMGRGHRVQRVGLRDVLLRYWCQAPDGTMHGESRNRAEPTPPADTRCVDRPTSRLCPWREWEPRKGSSSAQGGYHPPDEEQSLAARSTWVSAHATRNDLCPGTRPVSQGLLCPQRCS